MPYFDQLYNAGGPISGNLKRPSRAFGRSSPLSHVDFGTMSSTRRHIAIARLTIRAVFVDGELLAFCGRRSCRPQCCCPCDEVLKLPCLRMRWFVAETGVRQAAHPRLAQRGAESRRAQAPTRLKPFRRVAAGRQTAYGGSSTAQQYAVCRACRALHLSLLEDFQPFT